MGLFPDSLSVSQTNVSVLPPIPHNLYYYIFIATFEIVLAVLVFLVFFLFSSCSFVSPFVLLFKSWFLLNQFPILKIEVWPHVSHKAFVSDVSAVIFYDCFPHSVHFYHSVLIHIRAPQENRGHCNGIPKWLERKAKWQDSTSMLAPDY